MKHWSALKTGLIPAEFTRKRGENGLFGSGSIGGTPCGCWAQVSQEPSSSETRRRLSLKRAASFWFRPWTGVGMAEEGLGRGPGSLARKWREVDGVWAKTIEVTPPANRRKTIAIRMM